MRNKAEHHRGPQRLTVIIDASWKLKNTITEYVCVGEVVTYASPLPRKYHMFCFPKGKYSRVCKIGVHYDLQIFPMLLLTVNRNPCDPWAFQLMVYKT